MAQYNLSIAKLMISDDSENPSYFYYLSQALSNLMSVSIFLFVIGIIVAIIYPRDSTPSKRSRNAIIIGILVMVCPLAFLLVFDNILRESYMDEIFHMPQAIRYCSLDFTWDPKITTLPGLYLITFPVFLEHWIYAPFNKNVLVDPSVTFKLRVVNVVLFTLLYVVFVKIFHRDNSIGERRSELFLVSLKAARLCLLPLIFFFVFLYYTDVGSTFFVVASYYSLNVKKNSVLLASVLAFISVMFRQTNILWSFYLVGDRIFKTELFDGWARNSIVKKLGNVTVNVLKRYWSFILLGLAFVVFVKINDGIVVGDRENHQVIVHFAQFLYFTVFLCFFSFGTIVYEIFGKRRVRFNRLLLWRICKVGVLTVIFAFLGSKFTYIHKFILSDNRHYLFYLWRKLFFIASDPSNSLLSKHLSHFESNAAGMNFLYSIIYAICFVIITDFYLQPSERTTFQQTVRKYFLVFCVAANLTLMPVIEFRYYIIPWIMMVLFRYDVSHPKRVSWKVESLQIIGYMFINCVTMYLFLFRTFQYNDEEIGRLMW